MTLTLTLTLSVADYLTCIEVRTIHLPMIRNRKGEASVFATAWVHLSEVVRYYYPWNYCLLYMAYHLVGGLLVGLVMGAFVKPLEYAAP